MKLGKTQKEKWRKPNTQYTEISKKFKYPKKRKKRKKKKLIPIHSSHIGKKKLQFFCCLISKPTIYNQNGSKA